MTTADVRPTPGRGARGVLHLDPSVVDLSCSPEAVRTARRDGSEVAAARERALAVWADEHDRGLVPTQDEPAVQRASEGAALRLALAALSGPSPGLDPRPPSVVLAHRTDWLRTLVATDLLERGIAVVGSAGRRDEALAALVVHQPDVLVVSDRLVGASGLSLAQRARTLCPGVLVVAQVEADGNLRAALEVGAHAVLSRASRVQDLVDVICVLSPAGPGLPVPRSAAAG